MTKTYIAERCPCGHRACKSWLVSGVAQVQGVRFTEEQANAVAKLLNEMEKSKSGEDTLQKYAGGNW